MRGRPVLTTAAVVVLLLTTGCVGFLTGSEPLTSDAAPVEVSDDATAEAGYEEARVEPTRTNQSFTIAGQTRTVSVTSHVAGYLRPVERGPDGNGSFAQFTVFATPRIEVLGQPLNDIAGASEREVIARLRTGYDPLEDVRPVDNRTVEVLGEDRTVSRLRAISTGTGREVDLVLEVISFHHGEDVVVAVAIYPARLDGERARVGTLLRAIEHRTAN